MTTVDQAIKRGQLVINFPVFIIIFSSYGIFLFLAFGGYMPNRVSNLVAIIIGLLAVSIGPLTAWIYWSVAITYWRIWAYQNVEDINQLKLSATNQGLIWPEGSFFNKTEIITKKQRVIIEELEKKNKV